RYVFIGYFFFFQAEDGIRDRNVTGVQTCALPISLYHPFAWSIVMVILAVICNIIGRMMYSMLYETVKGQSFTVRIDWYTVISFLAVVYLYVLVDDALWTRLLPGVGLSLSA